ncbi:hypothetical protein DVH05_011219 [Phytophthora capsici]|nr:hypothetical protein DVH05_011219 [Phytophthora capsici]
MEGEDFKTLEAALALIEEYDDDSSAGSSSDSGDARCADVFQLLNQFPGKEMKTAAPNDRVESDKREIERLKAKLSFPGRNRSRDLHRLELLELRVEAAVLQREVDKLEEVHRLARSRVNGLRLGVRSTEETSLAEATDDLYDTWRNLAKKHKAYRRKAEIENRNLRELYTHQLKTTNTIKKLLRKQSCVK